MSQVHDTNLQQNACDPDRHSRVESTARVVAVDGRAAWLEPESNTGCGGCGASGRCGIQGLETPLGRSELRRFPLTEHPGLEVGERVVVGLGEMALLQASAVAYALPLLGALGAGALAQLIAGSDVLTLSAAAVGLGAGLLAGRRVARRLSAGGHLSPRFIRRAGAHEHCRRG